METIWIKNPLAIYTGNEQDARGGLVIRGNKIVELVALNATPDVQVDSVVNASQHVITPGLINAHHHFYQTLTRAYPDALNKELFHWLKSLYPVWANLDQEMMSVATELALVELMRSGCTTASIITTYYPMVWNMPSICKLKLHTALAYALFLLGVQ